MTKPEIPTPHQAAALRIALPSGAVRRLPGGWWVGGEHPEVRRGIVIVPRVQWAGTQTVKACASRGWLRINGIFRADLTDEGRAALNLVESTEPPTPVGP